MRQFLKLAQNRRTDSPLTVTSGYYSYLKCLLIKQYMKVVKSSNAVEAQQENQYLQPHLSHSTSPRATSVFNSSGGFHHVSKLELEEISLNSLVVGYLTHLLWDELVKQCIILVSFLMQLTFPGLFFYWNFFLAHQFLFFPSEHYIFIVCSLSLYLIFKVFSFFLPSVLRYN